MTRIQEYKPVYLHKKFRHVVGDLINEQLKDAQDFELGSYQDVVVELIVRSLCVLNHGVVAGHLLCHGDDEGRGACGGNETQRMTSRATGICLWAEGQAKRHTGKNIKNT